MTFRELNISEPVLKAVEQLNYTEPTPIQARAIPSAIEGRDILGIAQTGTGKTAAFAIPIIEQLMRKPVANGTRRPIRALILTPTRELAIQIDECFNDYIRFTDLRHAIVFGGVSQVPQVAELRKGADILIATPGRLIDLIGQRYISLGGIEHFVLDEADRMLDMGFIHDIRRIIPQLPKERQTMFFSATMPDAIANLSRTILYKPLRVEVTPSASPVEVIDQQLYMVEKPEKIKLLADVLAANPEKSILVFSRTKHGADKIAKVLNRSGVVCEAIHGNKSQTARQRALTDFKSGRTRLIIATDIAARGIDIAGLDMVINFDLPDVAETYVHRIGRTGRAGASGVALTFCTEEEYPMVTSIQKLTGKRLTVAQSA